MRYLRPVDFLWLPRARCLGDPNVGLTERETSCSGLPRREVRARVREAAKGSLDLGPLSHQYVLGNTCLFCPKVSLRYDAAEFEQAARYAQDSCAPLEDQITKLGEALGLYKGEYLPGCCQEWAARRRDMLTEEYVTLSRAFAEAALQAGQAREAADRLRAALAVDPYSDDLNLLYLEALGRLGRRAQLVAHYHRYCKLLANELGLDPPDRARSLYAELLG
jgi:DNA-binding SARP family transcriptional activator